MLSVSHEKSICILVRRLALSSNSSEMHDPGHKFWRHAWALLFRIHHQTVSRLFRDGHNGIASQSPFTAAR